VNYLLDTHTLIWFLEGNTTLSPNAREAIEDQQNVKYISIASIWEIAIKVSLNKLTFQKSFQDLLMELTGSELKILPISLSHIIRISNLQFFHKDPFDRIIIAQSLEEGFPIIGKDPNFPLYHVDILW
jgi:PIN domain nuclease of toxin-antitoxin system